MSKGRGRAVITTKEGKRVKHRRWRESAATTGASGRGSSKGKRSSGEETWRWEWGGGAPHLLEIADVPV